jgi:hypothetical protein
MSQIERTWRTVVPTENVAVNYELDLQMGLVLLRDWDSLVDFRYRPTRTGQLVKEVGDLILSQSGLKTIILKDAGFLQEKSHDYLALQRLLSSKGVAVLDWEDFAPNFGLGSYPEALIFNKKLLGLGAVLCFDSSLNILFGIREYSTAKVLELSAEALTRILIRSDAVALVQENMQWMKEASRLLNNRGLDDDSLQVGVDGRLFTLAVERSLTFDFRRQRDAARKGVPSPLQQHKSFSRKIQLRIRDFLQRLFS